MVRFFFVVTYLFTSFLCFAQDNLIQPKVDERTELVSIVFRLAGANEYVNNDVTGYVEAIDGYFNSYKDHELIKFVKKLRRTSGVSFDAVMSMAVNLEINGGIRLKENLSVESHDKRWGQKNVEKFVTFLDKFYFNTKFHDFYVSQKSLFQKAESNFNELFKNVDFRWFGSFYGFTPTGNYNLILSLTNGRGSYGPSVKYNDGHEDIYAVMGIQHIDSLGVPYYNQKAIPTIIHEFNHSFCNPLILLYFRDMEPHADKFYELVKDKMQAQHYGSSKTMLYESLVRACVINYYQYMKASDSRIKGMIYTEKSKGFIWIEELFNLLTVYENSRDKYLTLKDYMPEIVKMHNSLSPKTLATEFDRNCPSIIYSNIKNGSRKVDPKINILTVRFDKLMDNAFNGSSYGKRGEKLFPDFPEKVVARWDSTNYEWSIPVILKPEREYSISFPYQFFKDKNGYPLKNTFYLDFKTSK